MAVFDVVVNNADRKGGHVLEMTGGHRYGVDHGVTLHHEPKLRTVLWGWGGEPLTDAEIEVVSRLRGAVDAATSASPSRRTSPTSRSAPWSAGALACCSSGCLPMTRGEWPSIPWPPF